MTTINDTVAEAMNANGLSGYTSHVAPVVTALVNREQQIVGSIIEVARNSDLDVNTVRTTLANAGLHMPAEAPAAPAAPAATEASGQTVGGAVDAGLAQVLNRIDQTLNGLVAFARRNGYNG